VDIAKPPSGGLDLFNLYVALSQSSGHEIIWLLHDFDNQMFLKMHDVVLLAEDDWMERLDRIMKEWWQKMGRDKKHTENENE
jgi:small nuclear ribonucleoprotein (snRNP)-like protein